MPQSLSNLAIGTKVKFGKYSVNGEPVQDIIWEIVDKDYNSVMIPTTYTAPAYPTGSVTLFTERIIDLRAFDAVEPYIGGIGRNKYATSNIDQWLNSDAEAGKWYEARGANDTPPSTSERVGGYNTQYSERPGFLNAFSHYEKNAILTTSIRYGSDLLTPTDVIQRKVFLPDAFEIGIFNDPDSEHFSRPWQLYDDGSYKYGPSAKLTEQAFTYSNYKPLYNSELPWKYWLRDNVVYGGSNYVSIAKNVSSTGETSSECKWEFAHHGDVGVRPALNVSNTLLVSDTVDGDGCYTFLWNTAPTETTYINVPTNIFANKSNTITWGASTDADGDNITYVLECAYDGEDFSTIYRGSARSYAHTPPYGYNAVTYRVKAVDDSFANAESEYYTSPTCTVVNNHLPTISGTNGDIGTKTEGFTIGYTVTDTDGDALTVVESIDGKEQSRVTVNGTSTLSLDITDITWLLLTNGIHTLTIKVTDKWGEQAVRTYTFVKNVTVCSVQNSAPMESTSMPVRIAVDVNRVVAGGAIFKVEVCNNGFDANPTWEDATDSVKNNLVHLFTNTSKTASKWGVSVRVSIDRNGATGACYISSIGGNFE